MYYTSLSGEGLLSGLVGAAPACVCMYVCIYIIISISSRCNRVSMCVCIPCILWLNRLFSSAVRSLSLYTSPAPTPMMRALTCICIGDKH